MLNWLDSLLVGSRFFAALGPTDHQASTSTQASLFLSNTTLQWIENIRHKYDMPGIGIGLVGRFNHPEAEWKTETLSFGQKDELESPFEDHVSSH